MAPKAGSVAVTGGRIPLRGLRDPPPALPTPRASPAPSSASAPDQTQQGQQPGSDLGASFRTPAANRAAEQTSATGLDLGLDHLLVQNALRMSVRLDGAGLRILATNHLAGIGFTLAAGLDACCAGQTGNFQTNLGPAIGRRGIAKGTPSAIDVRARIGHTLTQSAALPVGTGNARATLQASPVGAVLALTAVHVLAGIRLALSIVADLAGRTAARVAILAHAVVAGCAWLTGEP